MYFKSKNIPLLILGITAVMCSRILFWFFDDPEGPNLLVVMVMAVVVYFPSLVAYLYYPKIKQEDIHSLQRLLLVIFIQIIIVTGFYFGLK